MPMPGKIVDDTRFNSATTVRSWKRQRPEIEAYIEAALQFGHDGEVVEKMYGPSSSINSIGFNSATTVRSWKRVTPRNWPGRAGSASIRPRR